MVKIARSRREAISIRQFTHRSAVTDGEKLSCRKENAHQQYEFLMIALDHSTSVYLWLLK